MLGHHSFFVDSICDGFLLPDLVHCHFLLMFSHLSSLVLADSVCRQLPLLAVLMKLRLALGFLHLELLIQRAGHLIQLWTPREIGCDGDTFLSWLFPRVVLGSSAVLLGD